MFGLLLRTAPGLEVEPDDLLASEKEPESESGQGNPRKKKRKTNAEAKKKTKKKTETKQNSAPSDAEKTVAKAKAKAKAKASTANVGAKKAFQPLSETMDKKRKRIQGELDDLHADGVCETESAEEARQRAIKTKIVFWMQLIVCHHHSIISITVTVTVTVSHNGHNQSACCSEAFSIVDHHQGSDI